MKGQKNISHANSNQKRTGAVILISDKINFKSKMLQEGFLGGAVVKNLPANAGDTGSIPGPGRSHMPWSN